MATQLVSRVRNVFELEFPLRTVFESPTIAGMMEQLKQEKQLRHIHRTGPQKRERQGAIPLSYAQQRLWFLDQLSGHGTSWLMSVVMRLRGELNVMLLEQSFGEVVRRHEILRTKLPVHDGMPVQVINEAGVWRLPVVDLSRLEPGKPKPKVRESSRKSSASHSTWWKGR